MRKNELFLALQELRESHRLLGAEYQNELEARKRREHEMAELRRTMREERHLRSCVLVSLVHELRAPLNGITGFAELLKQTDLSDDDRVQMADHILNAGRMMKDTLEMIVTANNNPENSNNFDQN
ncbi:MAG: histidine kinase dimerization/phospho-acceptor domain-containing protein [Bacteroidota bacterium]